MKRELIYLACPYSHPVARIKRHRFRMVSLAASFLIKAGYKVYSPVSHSHPIAIAGSLPGDWNYWKDHDELIMPICRTLIILQEPGWRESKGIKNEIRLARKYNLNVVYLSMDEIIKFCETLIALKGE